MAENTTFGAGRLPHACLIAAPSEQAAFERARRLAALAVCSGRGARPCGVCRDCRKAAADIHPDIITVARAVDDKGKLRQNITVDQVRSLIADASLLPNEAARKVYIIREAETMNVSAQNAALKLLEEPPAGVVFLLCTVNPQLLLPTIRSRCESVSVSGEEAPEDAEILELAEAYLKAAATGNEAQLLRWCAANEGMDNRTATAFVLLVKRLLTDMLCSRRKSHGLTGADMLRLCTLMDRCAQYLKVNTGVRHIFGLLAAASLPDSGNRG